jgi:hypothetical protein
MELFIRIKDGSPFEHPIIKENFVEAFPDVDLNNLPPEFARFNRIEPPTPSPYEVYEGVTYEWDNGAVTDVHHIRPLSQEEKLIKQNAVKNHWAQYGFASWVFNEEMCRFDSPVPYPDDGGNYKWNEETTSWVLVPLPKQTLT